MLVRRLWFEANLGTGANDRRHAHFLFGRPLRADLRLDGRYRLTVIAGPDGYDPRTVVAKVQDYVNRSQGASKE